MHPSSSPCSAPPPTSIHSALHVYQSGCRAQEKPFRGQKSHLYEYTPPNPPYLPLKMKFHIWFKKYPSPINKCVNHNPSASFDLWYPSRTVQLWQKSPESSLSSQLKNPFMTKNCCPSQSSLSSNFCPLCWNNTLFFTWDKTSKRRPT